MVMKPLITIVLLIPLLVFSQQKGPRPYRKEIGFTTENDAYLFAKKDAYYTNGFFVSFRFSEEKKTRKIMHAFELGQMIFTPLVRKTSGPQDIDRPYCGYLSLKYTHTSFSGNNTVLGYGVSLGQVGEASGGEAVQNTYHSLLHYAKFTGWGYQVQNAFGADLSFTYGTTVWEDSAGIKLAPVAEGRLGMNFTNASIGTYLCIGHFAKNRNSILWRAGAGEGKVTELFFFWYPQLIWQGYNATVQGGLLHKGTGAVLGKTEPWMYQHSIGLCVAAGRWSSRIAYIYQGKEAISQTMPQEYGSIQVNYRLH